MSAAPVLREGREGDAAAMARLHATGFDAGWPEADFAGWLDRDGAFVRVAEVEGVVAGFALALAAGEDAEILTIAVDPARRNAGIGRALLAALDADASQRRLVRWVLEVSRKNLAARALYSRVGFMEIGVRKAYYPSSDGPADAIVLACPVGWPPGGSGGQAGA